VLIVLTSGILNFLELSGPVHGCLGIALPYTSLMKICVHLVALFNPYPANLKNMVKKVIPLQACTGPEGFWEMRLPDFKKIGT